LTDVDGKMYSTIEVFTNLESLYDNIKGELGSEKNLDIVSEYKVEIIGILLRNIVAVNRSLKVFAGSLREIHVSMMGTPESG
jgi:hypothetical protein